MILKITSVRTVRLWAAALGGVAGLVVMPGECLSENQANDQGRNLGWSVPQEKPLDWSVLGLDSSGSLPLFNQAVTVESQGARKVFQGKTIEHYSPAELVEQIGRRNTRLAQQPHQVRQAQEKVVAAAAVFDPSLRVSLQYNRSRNRDRSESIARWRETAKSWEEVTAADVGSQYTITVNDVTVTRTVTTGDVGKTWFELGVGSESCITVDGDPMGDTCSNDPRFLTEEEYASVSSVYWSESWAGSVQGSKIFPWGTVANVAVNTTYTPYNYSLSTSLRSVGYPLDTALNLGETQWASDLSLGFSTPLPYSKNFGSQGNAAAVAVEQARLNAEKTRQQQDVQINAELEGGLTAYWELVRNLLAVESALLNQQVLEKRSEQLRHLLKSQRVTEYDLLSAEAGVESARNQEEIAWNNVILQTNRLAELLDLPPEKIVLPQGFVESLTKEEPVDWETIQRSALAHRAEIKYAEINSDGQKLEEQFRWQQLKPDLSLSFSYKVLGKGSAALFGYDNFSDSVLALFDPDEQQYYVGLNFSYPLGNHAAKSKHAQARTSHQRAIDGILDTRVSVTREVSNAMAEVRSREFRVRLAQANLKSALSAFETSDRLRTMDRITEFEYLKQHQVVAEARISLVNALIDRRLAHLHLLAGQGILGEDMEGNAAPKTGANP